MVQPVPKKLSVHAGKLQRLTWAQSSLEIMSNNKDAL